MYAVVKHSIPTLAALTLCLWLRPAEGGIGTPLSYAVPAQPNELVLLQGLHTPTELLINDKVPYRLSRPLLAGQWIYSPKFMGCFVAQISNNFLITFSASIITFTMPSIMTVHSCESFLCIIIIEISHTRLFFFFFTSHRIQGKIYSISFIVSTPHVLQSRIHTYLIEHRG